MLSEIKYPAPDSEPCVPCPTVMDLMYHCPIAVVVMNGFGSVFDVRDSLSGLLLVAFL